MEEPGESIIRTRRSLSRGSFNVSTPNNVSVNRIGSPGLELAKVAITNSRKRLRIKEERPEAKLRPPNNYPMKRENGMRKAFDSSSSMGNCSSPDILPLRRSRREKRLVYANFTPEEIKNTIQRKHLVEAFSEEEELEPYEKLFSPISKKPKNFSRRESSSHTYSTRSITSGLTEMKRYRVDTSQEDNEEDLSMGENESDVSNKNEDDGTMEEAERVVEEGTGEEEGTDEEEVEVELDEEESGYYNLRKRRPVVYQYQPVIQVVDKQTRKKTKKSSYSYRSAAYHPRTVRHSKDKFHRKAHQDSTTSSSEDSDEERFKRRKNRSMKRSRMECLPMNFAPEDVGAGPIRDRAHIGTSLADISPMGVDRSITFDSIGGLKEHIKGLKEMIMFPLMYPEVFDKFKISPPRGVLFHGPPGCGKTLVARALANECSSENRKVAFFMRKGADCLSKWVGESERQLRLLFDQAYQMRPSILFFDEIDGLAPVRSTRQDQIHSSIVSTLLALMDGLDSRGEIVVIGATNRIDSIDPALRRPGRFDREFVFPLPTRQDRKTILQIHTNCWQPALQGHFLEELSELTVGYCGADIKALCTEAAMHSLRRKYPQIYKSSDKLVIDVSKLVVSGSDFHLAYKGVVPTGQRTGLSVSRPLSDVVFPLVGYQFKALLNRLLSVFPQSWKCVRKGLADLNERIETDRERRREIEEMGIAFRPSHAHKSQHDKGNDRLPLNKIDGIFFDPQDCFATTNNEPLHEIRPHPHTLPPVHRPRLLITGAPGMGQSDHLSLALVHVCEDLPLKLLDSPTLLGPTYQSPEEACLQVIREACRVVPCIVYMPRVASLWKIMSEGFKATLKAVMDSLPPDMPLLLLGSTECEPEDLPEDLLQLFDISMENCFKTTPPSVADRTSFFHEALMKHSLLDPPQTPILAEEAVYEPLPLATPPLPRELSETETRKLSRQREAVLRELRVFLRETTNRLLAERKFKEFTKPVNSEEVPDYLAIIDYPMDLSTIMKHIDEHQYSVPRQWLRDIDLITTNALEYNPEHDTESRLLRHRAVALQDLAHSIFDHDLNEEFEQQCEDIDSTYKRINNIQSNHRSPSKGASLSPSDSMPYLTPRASFSSSKPAESQDDKSLEVRRSLRKLRVQPDTDGLPYYAPSKPRTPRKREEESSKEPKTEDVTMSDNDRDAPVISDSSSSVQHDNQTTEFNVVIQKSLSISSRKLSFSTKHKTSSTSSGSLGRRSASSAPPPFVATPTLQRLVIIDRARLVQLFNKVVKSTASYSVDQCLKVHVMLSQLVFRHRMEWNREQLLEELDVAVQELQRQRRL